MLTISHTKRRQKQCYTSYFMYPNSCIILSLALSFDSFLLHLFTLMWTQSWTQQYYYLYILLCLYITSVAALHALPVLVLMGSTRRCWAVAIEGGGVGLCSFRCSAAVTRALLELVCTPCASHTNYIHSCSQWWIIPCSKCAPVHHTPITSQTSYTHSCWQWCCAHCALPMYHQMTNNKTDTPKNI